MNTNRLNKIFSLCGTALATSLTCSAAGAADFTLTDKSRLSIDTACAVTIAPSTNNTAQIVINGTSEDAKKFTIRQQGDTIDVTETDDACKNSQSVISINNGGVVISGSVTNSTIVSNGGRVFINGKEVSPNDGAGKNAPQPRVEIKIPANLDVSAKLAGASSLVSTVPHKVASLNMSGATKASLSAESLDIFAAGMSKVTATQSGGDLRLTLAGQSNVEASGRFRDVSVILSGMGRITTSGGVTGNYTADASGMGNISHRGQIAGRVRQRSNGMAVINLGD